jgi:SPP1 gp7 family putative phage head morphogenesis protein
MLKGLLRKLDNALTFQTPESTTLPDEPNTQEVGVYSDLFAFNGINRDPFNPDDLIGNKGSKIYQKMMRDDQVKAVVNFKRGFAISRKWFFDVQEDNAKHEEQAEFFTFTLNNINGNFSDVLWGISSALPNGFSASEIIWGGIEFKDKAMWGIDAIKLRPFDTVEFNIDKHGNILKVEQRIGGDLIEIPMDKVVHFVHQPDIDEIWGESDLRACYRNWWSKDILIKFWNIFIERHSTGFLKATVDRTLTADENASLKNLMNNVSARMSAILPMGVTLESMSPEDTDAFEKALIFHDKSIAKAVLVPNLLGISEQGDTGSFAQSKVQFDAFMMTINAQILRRLEDVINERIIRPLAWWNFATDDFPRFKFADLSDAQLNELMTTWGELIRNGAVKHSETDEEHIRKIMGFPEKAEIEEPEPGQIPPPPPNGPEGEDVPDDIPPADENMPTEQEMAELKKDNSFFLEGKSDEVKQLFQDKPWLERVDFQQIEDGFDDSGEEFEDDINDTLGRVHLSFEKQIKKITGGESSFANVDPKLVSTVRVQKSHKSELNRKAKKSLGVVFDAGTKSAEEELPSKFQSDDRQGLQKTQAEKYLSNRSFQFAGNYSADLDKAVQNVLSNAIKENATLEQTIDALNTNATVTKLLPRVDQNGKPINKPTQLEMIARTSITDAFNQSRQSFFGDPDLKGFIQAFEFSAILDNRTSDICNSNHTKIRVNWGDRVPPLHPNCRSILVPITAVDPWDGKQSKLTQKGEPLDGFKVG